jgi:hypothetical protein
LVKYPLKASIKGEAETMNWVKERDLLISQTMAFVQSIAVSKTDHDVQARLRPDLPTGEPNSSVQRATLKPSAEQTETPSEIGQKLRPLQLDGMGMREEIQGRVAAFRAHQQAFHRERDAYFHAVLEKARGSADQPSAGS